MGQEFYSVNDVLKELQIEREELDALVEEGEVEAYREEGEIKFLKKAIDMFKLRKMDQPTLAVQHSEGNGQPILIPEEIDDDFMESDVSPEPILAMEEDGEHDFDYDAIDDGENTADASEMALLDISKNSSKDWKTGTEEELVFEEESGEDLLETGELLFESKDQLPSDREIEELFPDSEVSVSPFEASEEEAIKDAWELSEGMEEEVVSTTAAKDQKSLTFGESRRRKAVKTFGGIITVALVFTVLAVFVLFSHTAKLPEVKVCQIQQYTTQIDNIFKGYIRPAKLIPVKADQPGVIVDLIEEGTLVRKGDTLAKIQPNDQNDPTKLQKQLQKLQRAHKNTETKQRIARIPMILSSLKKQLKRHQNDPQKASQIRAKYAKYARYIKSYKRLRSKYSKQLPPKKRVTALVEILKQQADSERKEIARLKSLLTGKQHSVITALHNGILQSWSIRDNDVVYAAGTIVGEFAITENLLANFVIAKPGAKNWQVGDEVSLRYSGSSLTGKIKNIEQDNTTQPISLRLEVALGDLKNGLISEKEIELYYPSKKHSLGLDKKYQSAILNENMGNFLLVVSDDKIRKCKIEIREFAKNYISLASEQISAGDQVIYHSSKDMNKLEDEQSVTIQQN